MTRSATWRVEPGVKTLTEHRMYAGSNPAYRTKLYALVAQWTEREVSTF